MSELRIPLPSGDSKGTGIPQHLSYRWCAALHEALRPLKKFKLQDGGPAVAVDMVVGPAIIISLDENASDRSEDPWFYNAVSQGASEFVGRIILADSSRSYIEAIRLCLSDFLGDAKGAREAFAKVVKHLEEHAVPQVAPEWIENALVALQGGKPKNK